MLSITLKNVLLLLIAVIAAVLLVMFERRAKDPIVNLSYFTKRSTLFILPLALTSGFIMASTINLIPFFLETRFDVSKGLAPAGTIPLAAVSVMLIINRIADEHKSIIWNPYYEKGVKAIRTG